MTTPQSLDWLGRALADLDSNDLRRRRRIGAGLAQDTVDFGSNDYLGLAGDPRLAEAASQAARSLGWGAGASPVVSGRSDLHAELERRIAKFEGAEAAILFPSGFAANAGVIPALVDEADVVYSDAKNHASLIDGCRLARAERRVYPHADAATLARQLEQDAGRFRRRLIVTDGLFSMDGDFAPLPELGTLAERYDAMLLVDEAHATGVWGDSGRGSVQRAAQAHPGLESQVAVRVGTLSKALGSAGGFVAGSSELIDWVFNRARPYVFSTSPPPAFAAAGIAALQIVETEPVRRAKVYANAERLRELAANAGWRTGDSQSQIIPIQIGDAAQAVALSDRLAARGIFVPAIRPPSVPDGESLLRVSVSASHRETDLEALVGALGPADQSA